MKTLTVLTVALLTSVFGGCISSVNPLFTEDELIFNEDLVGDWSDGETKLSFTREGENSYILTTSEEGDEVGYKTHLVKLDNSTFLDIYPLDTLTTSYLYAATHVLVHNFWKIEIKQQEIILSETDSELVDSLINYSRFDIPYVRHPEGGILLTASTEKLQKFFQENENLFTNPMIYKKVNSQ